MDTPRNFISVAAVLAIALLTVTQASAAGPAVANAKSDTRILKVEYSPDAVVTIYTKRGQGTHIVLAPDEQLVGDPATGQGANCTVPTDTWCVAVAETGRDIILKPREGASPTNLLLVTNKRRHAFELVPVADGRAAMRVVVTVPPPVPVAAPLVVAASSAQPAPIAVPIVPPAMTAVELVANRMLAAPQVRNGEYSVAEGENGAEIVPRLVFDDGRFTYFRFANNLPLPAVFATNADKTEESVNTTMTQDGLLVADRVARRFVLRAGSAAVAILNEAFDPDGAAAVRGTSVPGVARVLVAQPAVQPTAQRGKQ
jgi:type IV secretion system protein VirB9